MRHVRFLVWLAALTVLGCGAAPSGGDADAEDEPETSKGVGLSGASGTVFGTDGAGLNVRAEASASSGERRHHLETALLQVSPKYREVLILKDIEELSYEEIRAILQLPLTTLKVRVIRARAMLRELIEREGVTS